MEDIATVAALAALASQITSLLKFLTGGEPKRALTTVIPWVAAFGVLLIGAQADATAGIVFPGIDSPLGDLDVASLLLVSTTIGAVGGFAHKAVTAVDNSTSTAEPALGDGLGV